MGSRTLSNVELTAHTRNKSEEKSLEEKLVKLNRKLYTSKDTIKEEIQIWRQFVQSTSRTSGWSPKSLRPEFGEDVLVPSSTFSSKTQLSFNRDSSNAKFQRPWAYTYSHASHNKVYKELHQTGTNSKKRLTLRSQVSSPGLVSNSKEENEDGDQLHPHPSLANEVCLATGVSKAKSAWGRISKLSSSVTNNKTPSGDSKKFGNDESLQESVKSNSGKNLSRQVTKVTLVNRAKSAWMTYDNTSLNQKQGEPTESNKINSLSKSSGSNLLTKKVSTVMGLKRSLDVLTCTLCGSNKSQSETSLKLSDVALSYKGVQRAKSVLTSATMSRSSDQQETKEKKDISKRAGCSCRCRKLRTPISQIWTSIEQKKSNSVDRVHQRTTLTESEVKEKSSSEKTIKEDCPTFTKTSTDTTATAAILPPMSNVISRRSVNESDERKGKNTRKSDEKNSDEKKNAREQESQFIERKEKVNAKEDEYKENKKSTISSVVLKSIDSIRVETKIAVNIEESALGCSDKSHSGNDKVIRHQDKGKAKQNATNAIKNRCRSVASLSGSVTHSEGFEYCTKILSVNDGNQIKEDGGKMLSCDSQEVQQCLVEEDKELRDSVTIIQHVIEPDCRQDNIIDSCLDGADSTKDKKSKTNEGIDTRYHKHEYKHVFAKETREKGDISRPNPSLEVDNNSNGNEINNTINTSSDSSSSQKIPESNPEQPTTSDQPRNKTLDSGRKNSTCSQKFKKIRHATSLIRYSKSFIRFELDRKHSIKPNHRITTGDDVFTRIAKVLWHKVKIMRRYRELLASRSQSIDQNCGSTWLSRQQSVTSHEEISPNSLEGNSVIGENQQCPENISTEESLVSPQKKRSSIIWEKAISRASIVNNIYASTIDAHKNATFQNHNSKNNNNNINNNNNNSSNSSSSNLDSLNNNTVFDMSDIFGDGQKQKAKSSYSKSYTQHVQREVQIESVNGDITTKTDDSVNNNLNSESSTAIKKPSRGLPARPFGGKGRIPAVYHRGIRLFNYVSPQQRYKTVTMSKPRRGLSIRWHSSVGVMVDAHSHVMADHEMDTALSKDARQRALTKLVEENNAQPEEEELEVISPCLRRRIEKFLVSIEPFCNNQD